jgi:predicted nuclease of predicted toxin-antitoxin system
MILADENIDLRIITALRGKGFEVVSVFENHRGINDEEVIKIATKKQFILLTEDKDFGEWVFAHHLDHLSVIFLRYHYNDTIKVVDILVNLLNNKLNELLGKYTTITIDKIRIRKL